MKTNIMRTSRDILSLLIEQASGKGRLQTFLRCDEIMEKLNMESKELVQFCIKYMKDAGYLKVVREDDDNTCLIDLTAKGIEFSETE